VVASNDAMQVAPKRAVPPDWLGTIPDLAIYGDSAGPPRHNKPSSHGLSSPPRWGRFFMPLEAAISIS
jgi:hypothetical protein